MSFFVVGDTRAKKRAGTVTGTLERRGGFCCLAACGLIGLADLPHELFGSHHDLITYGWRIVGKN